MPCLPKNVWTKVISIALKKYNFVFLLKAKISQIFKNQFKLKNSCRFGRSGVGRPLTIVATMVGSTVLHARWWLPNLWVPLVRSAHVMVLDPLLAVPGCVDRVFEDLGVHACLVLSNTIDAGRLVAPCGAGRSQKEDQEDDFVHDDSLCLWENQKKTEDSALFPIYLLNNKTMFFLDDSKFRNLKEEYNGLIQFP